MSADKKDIEVKRADQRKADRANKDALRKHLREEEALELADFIFENIELLQMMDLQRDWDLMRDVFYAGDKDGAKRRELIAVTQQADPKKLDKLKIKHQKFERTDPRDIAAERVKREEKDALRHAAGNESLLKFAKTSGSFLRNFVTGNIGATAADGFFATAHFLHGVRLKAGIGTLTGASVSLSAIASASAFAMSPIDVSIIQGGYITNAFQAACAADTNILDATYDMTFSPQVNENNKESVYYTMKVAERHGVPALALHLISYLESNRHTDMMSGNSTASGYFQMLDKTKFAYLAQYGQDTERYLEARDAIDNGTAKAEDRIFVRAIDAVKAESPENLQAMLSSKNMPDDIFTGLRYADQPDIAAELIAMDMARLTNIADRALSPEEILDITVGYYGEHHFLGMGNYSALEMLAQKFPSTPITHSGSVLGYKGEQNMVRIVNGNPGLLQDGMMAQEALDSIKDNFKQIVGPAYNKFVAVYDPNKTVAEICGVEVRTADGTPVVMTKLEYTGQVATTIYNIAALVASKPDKVFQAILPPATPAGPAPS